MSSTLFRAVVREVLLDSTGDQYAMRFKVEPIGSGPQTPESDGTLSNVFLQLPGFGSFEKGGKTDGYSGILFMPEEGSHVVVEKLGDAFYITGFLSGPVQTPTETGSDPEGRQISYNPGFEVDRSRQMASPGSNLDHWSGGLAPGDVILFRGQQRVKLCAHGIYVGSDLDNFVLFTPTGRRVSRCGDEEVRAPGLHRVHTADLGLTEVHDRQGDTLTPAEVAPGARVYEGEVFETGPYPFLGMPFQVRQRGLLCQSLLNEGRAAPVTDVTSYEAASETEAGAFVVEHVCWAWPLKAAAGAPIVRFDELDTAAAPVFDKQVDANGSFRINAGNLARAPGHQSSVQPSQMDLSLEYDSVLQVFTLRIGRAGSPAAVVSVRGDDPATSSVTVTAAEVNVLAAQKMTFAAGVALELVAPTIKLKGNVEVAGNLAVAGATTMTQAASAMGVSIANHVHPFIDTGAGAVGASKTSKPIPGPA
jgi:hypothetical protein